MKLFAAVSSLSLIATIAFAGAASSALGQVTAESPQASPVVQPAKPVQPTEAVEVDDFPEELRTRAPETLAEVKLLERRVQELAEKVRPATISMFGGTGVVVGKEGYILSAGHVVLEPGRQLRIRFADGTRATAITLGVDDRYDTGMAKITSDGDFPYLEMGNSSELKLGEWCLAVGFPVSFSRTNKPPVRLGRILSSRNRTIVSDCTIMGGDSGGPLFDLDGKVVGINSRVSGSLNQNVHVPVDIFTRDWDSLTSSEVYDRAGRLKPPASNRGFLGINWQGRVTPTIRRIISGSGAEKAGLKSGDLVLEIAGTRISEISDASRRLSSFSVGDEISVRVQRGEEVIQFQVTLGKRP